MQMDQLHELRGSSHQPKRVTGPQVSGPKTLKVILSDFRGGRLLTTVASTQISLMFWVFTCHELMRASVVDAVIAAFIDAVLDFLGIFIAVMALPWRARNGGAAAFAAFITFIAFMALPWRARSGGAAAFAAFITFIAMARDQLVFPQRRYQADDFMSQNGYGCVLTLPLLMLPLLLLLLLLLLQDDDG